MNGAAMEAALLVNIPEHELVSETRLQMILMVVAGHAHWEDAMCWPGVERIAAWARAGESTVRRALDHFRQHNILIRVKAPTNRDPAIWQMGSWYTPSDPPERRVLKVSAPGAQTEQSGVLSLGTEVLIQDIKKSRSLRSPKKPKTNGSAVGVPGRLPASRTPEEAEAEMRAAHPELYAALEAPAPARPVRGKRAKRGVTV